MATEHEWRPIPWAPTYLANTAGEVWSELLASTTPHGYRRVSLMRDDRTHYRYIHSLICSAFISPMRPGRSVGWRDGDRLNCGVDNVFWRDDPEARAPAYLPAWTPVPDFPGYLMSSSGRVMRRLATKDDGRGYRLFNPVVEGRTLTRSVHDAVCSAFHGPRPDPRLQAAHWNGLPADNRPENLRWATVAENAGDKFRHGTQPLGEASHLAKLSNLDVANIRARGAAGDRAAAIASEYGVHQTTISGIIRGTKRRHG